MAIHKVFLSHLQMKAAHKARSLHVAHQRHMGSSMGDVHQGLDQLLCRLVKMDRVE